MQKKRLIIIALLAVLATGAFLLFHKGKQHEHEPGMKQFVVRKADIHESIQATGEIKPCVGAEITLASRVTGEVVKEPVRIGDRVEKGDLVAIIDTRALKEQVDGAQAALDKVKAQYSNSIREQELEVKRQKLLEKNARQELEASRQELAFSEWDFRSQKTLFDRSIHSTSEKTFRKAKAALARSRASFNQAQNSLKAATLKLMEAETKLKRLQEEYVHALKIAETDLNRAKIRISYSTLRAPFSGVISYISTLEGETVVAGLNAPKFVKILDDTKTENRVYVDETEIGKIKMGMKVNFKVDAYVDHTYEGKISQIYPAPVLQNNVVYYIAVVTGFENMPKLRVQMTTHNNIQTRTVKDVIVVPNSAVRFRNGQYVVSLVENGKEKTVPVKTGASDSRFTEIKTGLEPGWKVLYRD